MTRRAITITNGKIEIDLTDIFEALEEDAKVTLIEALSCEDAILKHVTAQILEGYTENGYHGYGAYGGEEVPHSPLSRAIREVAKRSGEAAKREIERLEKNLHNVEIRITDRERTKLVNILKARGWLEAADYFEQQMVAEVMSS